VDGKSVDLHVEVLKRLPSIMEFMARQRKVSEQHIELLWKGTPPRATTRARVSRCLSCPLVAVTVTRCDAVACVR
jgi:hypothetical protein